jgi:UDP-glucose 4-epimerase
MTDMRKDIRVIVTGGAGFIGTATCDELRTHGYAARVFDIVNDKNEDVTDFDSLMRFMEDYNPNVMVHLAGLLGTSELLGMVSEAERVNVGGTINVLEACKREHVPIVFMSKPNPEDWHNVYTITKMTCEEYIKLYRKEFGMDITILRPFNAYGPNQKLRPIKKFCPVFIDAAMKGENIKVFGDGTQPIDPVHVNDIAKVVRMVIDGEVWGKEIEIGTGVPMKVSEFAERVIEEVKSFFDTKSIVEKAPMRVGEPEKTTSRIWADTTNMEKLLDFHPKDMIPIEDGLKETVGWYARKYQH